MSDQGGNVPDDDEPLLEGPELVELAKLFHAMLHTNPEARLKRLLPDAAAASLPRIDPADRSEGAFIDWLDACSAKQLAALLPLLKSNVVAKAALARIQERLEGGTWGLPWQVRMVVLNRTALWQQVEDLISGHRRIMLVRGERHSGKTYTATLLQEHLRRNGVPAEVIYVPVIGANSVVKVAQAAMRAMLGDPTTFPTNDPQGPSDLAASADWWVNEIARWLVLQAERDSEKQRWLVLDGYERVDPNDDMTALVSALALRALEGATTKPNGFRLILLDHPDGLPPQVSTAYLREQIGMVTELEVLEFLQKAKPTVEIEVLRSIAREVCTKADKKETRLVLLPTLLRRFVFDQKTEVVG